jgi:hypothetical protein
MSKAVQPYRQPEATPVGHSGARVDIHERPAWAINGWAGVLVLAACIAAAVLVAGSAWIIAPIVIQRRRRGARPDRRGLRWDG